MSAIDGGVRRSDAADAAQEVAPAAPAEEAQRAQAAAGTQAADPKAASGAWEGHKGDLGAQLVAARAQRPSGGFAAVGAQAAAAAAGAAPPAATRQQVVDFVASDKESFERIDSWLATAMPDGLGITGSLRNWGYVISMQDPTSDEIANKVCTGIADATTMAIERGIKEGKIDGVASAGQISRQKGLLGVHHTATLVTLRDGREFVFDWHATLNPKNPEISTKKEWLGG